MTDRLSLRGAAGGLLLASLAGLGVVCWRAGAGAPPVPPPQGPPMATMIELVRCRMERTRTGVYGHVVLLSPTQPGWCTLAVDDAAMVQRGTGTMPMLGWLLDEQVEAGQPARIVVLKTMHDLGR